MGVGYKRFRKELERAKSKDIKLILIIEGSLSKVLKGYSHSSIKGITVVKKLFTLWIKYDIVPVFCKNREEMSTYICEFYSAIGRKAIRDLKEKRGAEK